MPKINKLLKIYKENVDSYEYEYVESDLFSGLELTWGDVKAVRDSKKQIYVVPSGHDSVELLTVDSKVEVLTVDGINYRNSPLFNKDLEHGTLLEFSSPARVPTAFHNMF